MISGILVTHGNIAAELLETGRSIFGDVSHCFPLTNNGKTPDTLTAEIDKILNDAPSDDFIVFVDFFGGSASHAALRSTMGRPNVPILSGVNLPLVLAFLYLREQEPFERLPDELIKRGKGSIRIVSMEED